MQSVEEYDTQLRNPFSEKGEKVWNVLLQEDREIQSQALDSFYFVKLCSELCIFSHC